ncbi:MAG: MucB/RseB C-terminal domain-containing protein [Marinagarivorans sp.]|nr:MucB/RseB C-terminal domain-containing protein [Marinagarivorans sp.]
MWPIYTSPLLAGYFFAATLSLLVSGVVIAAEPLAKVEPLAATASSNPTVPAPLASEESTVLLTEQQRLERELLLMVAALDEQSYQGTLTYEFGGPLETLVFEHLVSTSGTQERIRHLSGYQRFFSRHLPHEHCSNAAMRLFAQQGQNPLGHLENYYAFRALGQNRFADRRVNMVQILPKDQYRFGFTLGIDSETHLPLMVALMGPRGEMLERFQFIQMAAVAPSNDSSAASMAGAQALAYADSNCEQPLLESGWQPQWLPDGFVLASIDDSAHKTVMSYTDGLASLSIFVVPITEASGAVGVVQRGATVVAMLLAAQNQKSYKVSVVGEVPAGVARRVASSVIYVNDKAEVVTHE